MSNYSRGLAFRQLIYTGLAFVGIAVLAIGMAVWALRSDAIEQASTDTENTAAWLAQQTSDSIRSVDLVLSELQDQIAKRYASNQIDPWAQLRAQESYFLLKERLARLPQGESIEIVGTAGRVVNSTREWPVKYDQFAGQAPLTQAPERGTALIHVGGADGGIIHFSRRVDAPGGNVIGFVTIGVNFRYLRPLYQWMASHYGQSFSLVRSDGSLLISYPEGKKSADQSVVTSDLWHQAVSRGEGSYPLTAMHDGLRHRVIVRPLREYPLVVNVASPEAAALNKWERRATYIAGGTLLAVLCLVFLLRALVNQFQKLLQSEASLSEREMKLADKSRELELANGKIDAALNNMSQGLCMFDRDERLVVCNQRYLQMYGLSKEQAKPGCSLRSILEYKAERGTFGEDVDHYLDGTHRWLAEGGSGYLTSRLTDGRIIAIHREPVAGGGWVATHDDVTERQRTEARIAHMARHDALTDLANRAVFREELDKALARSQRQGDGSCILSIDLDLFKVVNDSLGHPVGDNLLRVVAQRLLTTVRETDTVARLGGDEFAILLTAPDNSHESAIALADRLLQTLSAPYNVEGHHITVGTSIGIALVPDHGADADQLLKNADLALYRAKSEGRNCYRFFEVGMDVEAKLRRELEVDLREAFADGQFKLYYQNVVDIRTQETCGVEALVRWTHPARGLIPPDKFIPLAEEIGLIIPLGKWILNQACADAVHWPSSVKVAVNLSPVQFRADDLVEVVASALDASGLQPGRLELEITESVLLHKSEANIAVMHELKNLGVSIVLDDFGTGYSSLSYLRIFPFNKIKIDRSFVAEMSTRDDCAAIVCAVAGLGRSLGVESTAEGVETKEQFELLRAAGCTQAQGYLFSRPCPVSELNFLPHVSRKQRRAS